MPHQKDQPSTISLTDTLLRLRVDAGSATAYMSCPQCGFILVSCRLDWSTLRSSEGLSPNERLREQIGQLLTDSFGHLEHVCRGE